MTLSEPGNFNDRDRQLASDEGIHNFDVCNEQNEKIGKVIRIERTGLGSSLDVVIKVGSWLANRQVSIPLQNYRIDFNAHRLYVGGWSREQVSRLPIYSDQVRITDSYVGLETPTPLESAAQLEAPFIREIHSYSIPLETPHLSQPELAPPVTDKDRINQAVPTARILAEEVIPLLAERVIVDRHKRKSGEVVIRKVIETEVVEVLVRREKLIVEQVSPEYKELAVIDLGRTSVEEAVSSQAESNDLAK